MAGKQISGAHRKLSRRENISGSTAAAAISTAPVLPGRSRAASSGIVPFAYHASAEALDDLKRRLRNTRFPDAATARDWSQGIPLEKLQALIGYWEASYD